MEVSQDHWNDMLVIVIVLPGWASHGFEDRRMPAKAHFGHTRTVWRPRRDLLKLIRLLGGYPSNPVNNYRGRGASNPGPRAGA